MIVSHLHKFIFVKTHKTAGTSIELDLAKHLGPNDVATPIVVNDVIINSPQNYEMFYESGVYNHATAQSIKQLVGDAVWNEYTVFCVEREPVDKCISKYNQLNSISSLTWKNFLLNYKNVFPIDTNSYTDDIGNLIVDKIIKYENLENELNETLNFDFKLSSRARQVVRDSVLLVTEQQKEFIYEQFAESNKYTGYKLCVKN